MRLHSGFLSLHSSLFTFSGSILNSQKIILHFQYSSESSIFLEKRREKCLIFLLIYDLIRLYVNRKQVLLWHWIKRYR